MSVYSCLLQLKQRCQMNTHHCFHPYTDKISTMSNLLSNQRFKNLQRFNKCRIKMLSTRCQYNSHSKKCNLQNNNFFKIHHRSNLTKPKFRLSFCLFDPKHARLAVPIRFKLFLEKSEYLYEIQKQTRS